MPSTKSLLTSRARQLRRQATDAETRLWQQLRHRQLGGAKFRRQVPVGGYILDFYCWEAKLGIELDGGQHLQQEAYDQKRTEALAGLGIRVLRFWNDVVLTEMEAVVRVILEELDQQQGKPG
jgi:very-short-patch-repair endonuclease